MFSWSYAFVMMCKNWRYGTVCIPQRRMHAARTLNEEKSNNNDITVTMYHLHSMHALSLSLSGCVSICVWVCCSSLIIFASLYHCCVPVSALRSLALVCMSLVYSISHSLTLSFFSISIPFGLAVCFQQWSFRLAFRVRVCAFERHIQLCMAI